MVATAAGKLLEKVVHRVVLDWLEENTGVLAWPCACLPLRECQEMQGMIIWCMCLASMISLFGNLQIISFPWWHSPVMEPLPLTATYQRKV